MALEVANRRAIRETQRKEVTRLKSTLGDLKKHQTYLDDQMTDNNSYLKACKEQQMLVARKTKKGKKKEALPKFKEAYALVPTPITALALAIAYEDTGDLVAALSTCDAAAKLSPKPNESNDAKAARADLVKRRAALLPRGSMMIDAGRTASLT